MRRSCGSGPRRWDTEQVQFGSPQITSDSLNHFQSVHSNNGSRFGSPSIWLVPGSPRLLLLSSDSVRVRPPLATRRASGPSFLGLCDKDISRRGTLNVSSFVAHRFVRSFVRPVIFPPRPTLRSLFRSFLVSTKDAIPTLFNRLQFYPRSHTAFRFR